MLSDSDANRPFLNYSEVDDHDWMELAWTLRYQHPEIFREVLLILRARARAEEGQAAGVAQPSSAEQRPPAGQEEESAL